LNFFENTDGPVAPDPSECYSIIWMLMVVLVWS